MDKYTSKGKIDMDNDDLQDDWGLLKRYIVKSHYAYQPYTYAYRTYTEKEYKEYLNQKKNEHRP